MEDKEGHAPESMGIFNFIIVIMGCALIAFFAVSSLFSMGKDVPNSYYVTKYSVSDFSLTDNIISFHKENVQDFVLGENVITFNMKGVSVDYTIEFDEPPIIQKTDKIDLYYNRKEKNVYLYINDKMAYNEFSNLTFTMKKGNKEDGSFASKVIKNIKTDDKIPVKSI